MTLVPSSYGLSSFYVFLDTSLLTNSLIDISCYLSIYRHTLFSLNVENSLVSDATNQSSLV